MLACARIGAVHSVVFGGFAPRELAVRIDDATPKVIVSASCGIEGKRVIEYKPLLDEAIELADAQARQAGHPAAPAGDRASMGPRRRRLGRGDGDADAGGAACRSRPPTRSTSSTPRAPPGSPRACVRDTGGYAVALAWTMANIYDIGPGETMFTASDVGWVVGHSYIVYAPLLAGATTVLYEGKPVGTPDAGQFWRVVAEHGVKSLFTAPTAFRAIKKEDPQGELLAGYDLSRLRVPVPGRRAARPGDLPLGHRPARHPGDRPLVADRDRLGDRGEPGRHRAAADQAGLADPADARLGRADPRPARRPVPAGEDGAIVIKLPLPPGRAADPVERRRALRRSYLSAYDGYYLTGDGGHLDEDGYLFVMGRTDDVINVAGHRLSTGGWRRCSPGTRTSPSAPSSAWPTRSRARCRAGSSCSRPGVDRDEDELRAELVALSARADRRGGRAEARSPSSRRCRRPGPGKILRKTMRGIADGLTSRCRPPSRTRRAGRAAPGAAQALTRVAVPRRRVAIPRRQLRVAHAPQPGWAVRPNLR